jgi:chitosanase
MKKSLNIALSAVFLFCCITLLPSSKVFAATNPDLALGKLPISSRTFTNISLTTDGNKDTNMYSGSTSGGVQWVQIDLGAKYNVNQIKLWHYYGDSRKYHDVVVRLSNDASFSTGVTTAFNNDTNNSAGMGAGTDSEYTEISAGKDISFNAVNARYVRLYSNGSNVNVYNHYVEVEIYSSAAVAPTIMSIAGINAAVNLNASYALPGSVKANMSDGTTKDVSVLWTPPAANTSAAGIFTFTGTVSGYSAKVTATLTVVPAIITKSVILQLTTACENSATKLQFNYAENIYDGRGITFGCIGFCTGTYDGNMLIKYYTQLNPNNTLAKYIPALDAIDNGSHNGNGGDSSSSTAGLSGFIQDVNNCTDPLFKQAQLHMLDQLYWNPSVNILNNIGGKNPLTQAFIYDMCVNHGQDEAQGFIDSAAKALGGTPKTGINENTFLSKVMDLRYNYLKSNEPDGLDRVNAYKRILTSGNVNLVTPITFTVYGDTFTIDCNVYYNIKRAKLYPVSRRKLDSNITRKSNSKSHG